MTRHAIHLGTAWETPSPDMPGWVRRFGRPAGVEPGERVLLVCEHSEPVSPWTLATLNGHRLDWREVSPGMLECEVTGLLAARNHLVVPGDRAAGAGDTRPARRAALPEAGGRLSLVIVSD